MTVMPLVSNYKEDKFDVDLRYARQFEELVAEIFEDGGRVEVKTERNIWATTGNIAVEIMCREKPSGLSITDADYWIHLLALDDDVFGGFIFPTQKLKERIKELLKDKTAKIQYGGDDNASKLVLIPINKLFSKK